MFNFGFTEVILILIVAILVIGPKELPVVMTQVGRLFKRLSYVRFAVQQQMDSFMQQSGLNDVKQQVNFESTHFDEATHDAVDSVLPAPQDAHAKAVADAKRAEAKPAPKGAKKTKPTKKPTAKKATPKKSQAKKKASPKKATPKKIIAKKTATKAKTKAGDKA